VTGVIRPSAADPGTIGHSVDRMRLIPDRHRAFSVSETMARTQFRFPAAILDEAVAVGLPCATGRVRRFDHYDLVNLSLALDMRSVWTFAVRSWHRVLNVCHEREAMRYSIGYTPTCPHPGHPGDCRFSVLLPDGAWSERPRPARSQAPVATVEFTRPTRWPELPAAVRGLLDDFGDLHFMRLPPTLQQDVGFVRSSGIADCAGYALLLREEGRRRALPISLAFGLIIGPPFSSMHCWNEVEVDGRRVPIDPLIVSAMLQWGDLDANRWNRYSSPGAILGKLSDEITATATHDGDLVQITFPTRSLPLEKE
jgi:hypothetical protein